MLYKRALEDILIPFLKNTIEDSKRVYALRAYLAKPRIKTKKRTLEKAREQGYSEEEIFDKIKDIAGARIICFNIQDIFTVLHSIEKAALANANLQLHQNDKDDKIIIGTKKGYHAYHVILKVECQYKFKTELVPCEVQLQTLAQNMWCELSHADVYRKQETETMKKLGDYLFGADIVAQMLRERLLHTPPGEFKEETPGTNIKPTDIREGMWYFWTQIHLDNIRKYGVSSREELENIWGNEDLKKWFADTWEKYTGQSGRSRSRTPERRYFTVIAAKKKREDAEKLMRDYLESFRHLGHLARHVYDVPRKHKVDDIIPQNNKPT